jgi:FkbM family methyltransferase
MSLSDMAKRLLPYGLRNTLGVGGIRLIARSGIGMSLFSLIADWRLLGVKVLPGGLCSRLVDGREIVSYRDGFRVFHEIYDNKPYEKYWSPRKGDVVLDLGAYVGMFSYRASLLVGEDGMVVAVEPDDNNMKLLLRNVAGLSNIITVESAVGETNGTTALYISPKTTCHNTVNKESGRESLARITTIDTLAKTLKLSHVDYIKIDVEGAELEALRGAVDTLTNNNVRLAIEYYHASDRGVSGGVISGFLATLGYEVKIEKEYIYAQRGRF